MSQDQVTGQPVDPREEKKVVTETVTEPAPVEPAKVTESTTTETTVEPVQPQE